MIKSDFINKCEELHVRVPFRMIVDIYKDEDEIPNELIRILFEPSKPKQQILYMSERGYNALNDATKKYIENNG